MRHRFTFVMTIALAALFVLPAAVQPATTEARSCGPCPATTTAYLNLRAGPSLSDTVLLVIPAGSQVDWDPSQGEINGYLAVTYAGVSGWSHGDYLDRNGGGIPDPGSGFPIGSTVMVNTDALNVRASASLGGQVIGVAFYGAQGTVLEPPIPVDGYLWHRVDLGPSIGAGWVAGSFLAHASDGGGGGFSIGDMVVVVDGPLNYRTDPYIGAGVLEVLATGTEGAILDGPVYAGGWTWYQLGLPGYGPDGATPGWVAGEFLGDQ